MRPVIVAVLFAIGCGGEGTGNPGDPVDARVGDGKLPDPDAYVPPGYTQLISGKWAVPAGGNDIYHCARKTVTQDMWITNIQAAAPLGSHHTVLSISDSRTQGPDGEYPCDVGELGMVMLYASGVGTSPLDFPQDVGIKIAAGTQIHLNLHLFNSSDVPIDGTSGINVKSQSTPTPILAEMVFAGKFLFQIPSNNQPYNVIGGCAFDRDFKLFALWPHMHQLARHHKVEMTRGGVVTTLHDQAYDFEEQNYYKREPVYDVQMGDRIKVTCTFVNNTGSAVGFGDSSNQEMCFTGMYRYPAMGAGLFQCTDVPGGGF